jgi:hypothetical protein
MPGLAIAAAPQVRARRRAFVLVFLCVLLAGSAFGAFPRTVAAQPVLKAVVIVGPTAELTTQNLTHGEAIAQLAEKFGMEVRRVFHPYATWDNVLANIQNANLVVYLGHGYGWPSPWGFSEKSQNGFGLNPIEGGARNQVKYYGARQIVANVRLAPNALVLLDHLCYAAGNGEAGMVIPSWSVAQQRVDNYAAGFLAAGAHGVFAYSYQTFDATVKALFKTDRTMASLFTTPGAYPRPLYGYVGWDARQLESIRTPGTINWLDPHEKQGFLRAFSGDPAMTAADWRAGAMEADPTPSPSPDVTPTPAGGPSTPAELSATALDRRYVQLAWQPASGGDGALSYRIQRDGVRIARGVSDAGYLDRPPAVGVYEYRVRAVDAAGNMSVFSATVSVTAVKVTGDPPPSPTPSPSPSPSPTPTVTPPAGGPTAPTELAATSLDRRYVELAWQPASGGEGGLSYRIQRNGVRIARGVTDTGYLDRAPSFGVYEYRVRAVDAAGNKSVFSPSVSVTAVKVADPPPSPSPSPSDAAAPSQPKKLVAEAAGHRYVGLAWKASSGGVGKISYRIKRNGVRIAIVTGTTFVDRPLLAGRYRYKVRAVDAAGNKSIFTPLVDGWAIKGTL